MTPWKLLILVTMLLVPGGSFFLLAMATAKAFKAGWDRLPRRATVTVTPG
jgi:hypothetical protein